MSLAAGSRLGPYEILAPLGAGVLLAVDSLARFASENGLEVLRVAVGEEAAANVLVLESGVIMPDGYPKTQAHIAQTGRRVHPVPMSEFEKRDGGVTCLSVLY